MREKKSGDWPVSDAVPDEVQQGQDSRGWRCTVFVDS